MAYLPNTAQEQAEMLQELELSRLDDLFRQVPDHSPTHGAPTTWT